MALPDCTPPNTRLSATLADVALCRLRPLGFRGYLAVHVQNRGGHVPDNDGDSGC